MDYLTKILKKRLSSFEIFAESGQIPGHTDRYDLEQVIGRIKELKNLLYLIESISTETIEFDTLPKLSCGHDSRTIHIVNGKTNQWEVRCKICDEDNYALD